MERVESDGEFVTRARRLVTALVTEQISCSYSEHQARQLVTRK